MTFPRSFAKNDGEVAGVTGERESSPRVPLGTKSFPELRETGGRETNEALPQGRASFGKIMLEGGACSLPDRVSLTDRDAVLRAVVRARRAA